MRRPQRFLWLVCIALISASCTQSPVASPTTTAPNTAPVTPSEWTSTPISALAPTATIASTPTAAPTATITPTLTASPTETFVPQPVTAQNAASLTLIASLGRGAVRQSVWSPDGKYLAILSSTGVWLYDAKTFEDVRNWETPTQQISIAYSPDSTIIASGGIDKKIHLWKAEDGSELRQMAGSKDIANVLAFSPDGSTLAASSFGFDDNFVFATGLSTTTLIELWNVADGSLEKTLEPHVLGVFSLEFSPDGKLLASGGALPGTTMGNLGTNAKGYVDLWDVTGGKNPRSTWQHGKSVSKIAFSPDSQILYSISDDPDVRIWNVQTGQSENLRAYSGPFSAVLTAFALRPDGARFTVGGLSAQAQSSTKISTGMAEWDAGTRRKLLDLDSDSSGAQSYPTGDRRAIDMVYNPTGDRLVIGASVWDAASGKKIWIPPGHIDSAVIDGRDNWLDNRARLAVSPDDRWVAIAPATMPVRIWDITTRAPALSPDQTATHTLGFSPDGSHLVLADSREIALWDTQSGSLSELYNSTTDWGLDSAVISADGGTLAAQERVFLTSGATSVLLWNLASGDAKPLRVGGWYITRAVRADGSLLAVDRVDLLASDIQFFQSSDHWKAWRSPFSDIPLFSIQIQVEGSPVFPTLSDMEINPIVDQALTCGQDDATARVWDLQKGSQIRMNQLGKPTYGSGHDVYYVTHPATNKCYDAAYSADGSVVALALMDHTVKVYSADLTQELATLSGPTQQVLAVAFSQDGKLLAAYSEDGRIWLWETPAH